MDRRTFLKALPIGVAAVAGGTRPLERPGSRPALEHTAPDPIRDEGARLRRGGPDERVTGLAESSEAHLHRPRAPAAPETSHAATQHGPPVPSAPDPRKAADFDRPYEDDYVLEPEALALLESVVGRLGRAQRVIGHGRFNILGFEHLLRYARNYSSIDPFSAEELAFLEEIFTADPRRYGFFGERVTHELGAAIPQRELAKVAGSGHYLLRGSSLEKYQRIRRDLGKGVVLTSGVRGVVKQFHLFLAKAVVTRGNLSQASRSLAPPGFSYHYAGDFDVGKDGFGAENFTEAFAKTDEYRKMIDLGYVSIRYTEANPFGVRHEPWHVKVV